MILRSDLCALNSFRTDVLLKIHSKVHERLTAFMFSNLNYAGKDVIKHHLSLIKNLICYILVSMLTLIY